MAVELSKTADGDQKIDGRYQRLKKSLGKGSFKHVYEAFDKREQKDVAWNIVDLSQIRSDSELEKIKKETNILKSLKHRNILRIHDTWINEQRDKLIFITDIMRDGSLLEYIMNRDITLGRVKEFCREIINALIYLHAGVGWPPKPIIHRDLKCDNIFIDASMNRIVLGDLGLSTSIGSSKTTAGQSVVGTPEFMAPEMFEEKYNEKVDIYAFGMCVVQMVTKKYPYQECHTLHQVYKKITKKEWPNVMNTITSKSVRDFIQCCCAFKIEKRPTAAMLSEHPFLNFWYPIDQLSCSDKLIVGRSEVSVPEGTEKPIKQIKPSKSPSLTPIEEHESKAFYVQSPGPSDVQREPTMVKRQLSSAEPINIAPDDRFEFPSHEVEAPSPQTPQFTPHLTGKSGAQQLSEDRKAQVIKAEEYEAGHLKIFLNVLCKTKGHLDNKATYIIKSVSFDYKIGEDTPESIAVEMVEDLGLTPKKEMLSAIGEALSEENINAMKMTVPSSMVSLNDRIPKLASKPADSINHESMSAHISTVTTKAAGSLQMTPNGLLQRHNIINISERESAPKIVLTQKPSTKMVKPTEMKVQDGSYTRLYSSPHNSRQGNTVLGTLTTEPIPKEAREQVNVKISSPSVEYDAYKAQIKSPNKTTNHSPNYSSTRSNLTLKKTTSTKTVSSSQHHPTEWSVQSNQQLPIIASHSTPYMPSPIKAALAQVPNDLSSNGVCGPSEPKIFLLPGQAHHPQPGYAETPPCQTRLNGQQVGEFVRIEGDNAPGSLNQESPGQIGATGMLNDDLGCNSAVCATADSKYCEGEVITPKIHQGEDGAAMQTEPSPFRSSSIRVKLPTSATEEERIVALNSVSHTQTSRLSVRTPMSPEVPAKRVIPREKKEQMTDENARLLQPKKPIVVKMSKKEMIEQRMKEEKKKLEDESLLGKDAERAKSSIGSLSKSLVKSNVSKSPHEGLLSCPLKKEPLSPHVSNASLIAVHGRNKHPVTIEEDRSKSNIGNSNRAPTGTGKKIPHREDESKLMETISGTSKPRKLVPRYERLPADETDPALLSPPETSPELLNGRSAEATSIESPRSVADDWQRHIPYHQNLDVDHDGTVIGSGDESQGGRTTPGGQSSFLTESKQPGNSDTVADFNIRARQHLQSINKKLDEKRKNIMKEYRARLDEIDEIMDFKYTNLKKTTKDPELQKRIEGMMSEFKQQFDQMKLQSEDFEKNCGLTMPQCLGPGL